MGNWHERRKTREKLDSCRPSIKESSYPRLERPAGGKKTPRRKEKVFEERLGLGKGVRKYCDQDSRKNIVPTRKTIPIRTEEKKCPSDYEGYGISRKIDICAPSTSHGEFHPREKKKRGAEEKKLREYNTFGLQERRYHGRHLSKRRSMWIIKRRGAFGSGKKRLAVRDIGDHRVLFRLRESATANFGK